MADEKKTSNKVEKTNKSKDKKKSKKNPFKSIASFFKSVKAEGKKVVWSPAKDVLRNTVIVLIVITVVGLCIYGVDSLLSLGMKGIKNLAETTTASEEVETTTTAEALDEATESDTDAESDSEDVSEDNATDAETTEAAE